MTDARLEHLDREACLRLLREANVGRIAFVVDDHPIILPVNYRLVEPDSIDPVHHEGWSIR